MGRALCCEKIGLKRGKWAAEEDEKLRIYIEANGEGSWRSLPKNAGLLRCGKSCRLRWINYLRSDLKRGNICAAEEEIIINLHASLGNRWSQIAAHMPGRTDNEIKNYWNSHLSRKFCRPDPAFIPPPPANPHRIAGGRKKSKKTDGEIHSKLPELVEDHAGEANPAVVMPTTPIAGRESVFGSTQRPENNIIGGGIAPAPCPAAEIESGMCDLENDLSEIWGRGEEFGVENGSKKESVYSWILEDDDDHWGDDDAEKQNAMLSWLLS